MSNLLTISLISHKIDKKKLEEEIEKLKSQKDELIAALEMACKVMEKNPTCQFTYRMVKAKMEKAKGVTHA